MRRAAALLLVGALAVGCGDEAAMAPVAGRPPSPSTVVTTPAAPAPAPLEPSDLTPRSLWRIGASPLPLRADGFGEVLPTPPVLRDRRLPTVDRLPPPRDGQFAAMVGPVTEAIRTRMGETWSPGCPVALSWLRYLTVSFRGFDGKAHTGELVVSAAEVWNVVEAFRRLYALSFPIEEMRLPTTADLRAAPTGDGNNTFAYLCLPARGEPTGSAHAYGTALDINPFQNPEVRGDLVLPELASAYADRSWRRPGMLVAGGPQVAALAAVGWVWGGSRRSGADPMHFSSTGS